MTDGHLPDLSLFDYIVINSSAGKDSQAMLDYVVEKAGLAKVVATLIVVHADLGRIEWPGTRELAEEHAAHYGLRFEVCKRTQVGDLLAEIKRRGKWPSSTERYCTSYYKRDQIAKLYTQLGKEHGNRGCRILNCLGFRAEESPRRRKLADFKKNDRCSTGRKLVYDWLPIHQWELADVWKRIRQAGTKPHYAYALGMTRLSCRFCIFAPKSQLMISAKYNPELFLEYVQAEKDMNHRFRVNLSLIEVQEALDRNEEVETDNGAWNM